MPTPEWSRQRQAEVRFEWGPAGVDALDGDAVVIVDVLRFTTAVDAAVGRRASVYPYRWRDPSAREYADQLGAQLADGRTDAWSSLSPVRLARLAPGDRIVLPSPNGSTCAAVASEGGATVLAACLRNARAVATWLNGRTGSVSVIACGERWPDGSLRPSLEDHLGAGAVLAHLQGRRSPEAEAAALLWDGARGRAATLIRDSASGRELAERGGDHDLTFACEVHASTTVPVLVDGAFVDVASS